MQLFDSQVACGCIDGMLFVGVAELCDCVDGELRVVACDAGIQRNNHKAKFRPAAGNSQGAK